MIQYLFIRVKFIFIFRKYRTTKEEEENQIEMDPKIPTKQIYGSRNCCIL